MMRTTPVSNVSFGRRLRKSEEARYERVLHQAQEVLDIDKGKSTLLIHEPCLPQNASNNTGASTLSSKSSLEFFDYMKKYLGINSVQVLPMSEYSSLNTFDFNVNPNPYTSGSFGLGEQTINLELFKGDEYSRIIKDEDIKEVVKNNSFVDVTNIDNVVGENSAQRGVLKKAWKRFLELDSENPLRKEFKTYKGENGTFLKQKGLFKALSKENGTSDWRMWSELDKNLLLLDTKEAKDRIVFLEKKYKNEMDFYSFRQFLADKSLSIGKIELNKRGLNLFGDCPINFSNDEVWANQRAFRLNDEIGWGVPSLDYRKLYNEDGTLGDAGKLLQQKFEYYLKRYDGLRLDAGWSYSTNRYVNKETGKCTFENLGDKVFQLIEKTARRIKGDDFDLKNLMYEAEADEGLGAIDWASGTPVERGAFKGRSKIYTTSYMHEGWGSSDFLLNGAKMNGEEIVLGVGNHDSIPLRKLAEDMESERVQEQVSALSKIFNLPRKYLEDIKNFIATKNAEILGVKNRSYFFMDIFGRNEIFNNLSDNEKTINDFRYKIPTDYESAYHKGLQDGYGLNIMDSFRKAFIKNGYDKTNPDLFNEIVEFSEILYKKESKGNKWLMLTGALWVFGLGFLAHKIKNSSHKTAEPQIQDIKINLSEKEKDIFQKLL